MEIVNRILMLILIFSLLSCDKEDVSQRPMSQTDIWSCYNNLEWSDLEIWNELIGSWKWIYTESYWAPDKGGNTESENTLIEFLSDSTLNVIVDGELKSTTKWTIVIKDGDLYGLELDSSATTLLYGRILICGEIVEFNNSYIDGSDNYFEKIE